MYILFLLMNVACNECKDCEFNFQSTSDKKENVEVLDIEEPEHLVDYIKLPDNCDALPISDDPIIQSNNYFVQGDVFAELLDVEIDEEHQEVFAVGQGGLMRFSLSPEYTLTQLTNDEGSRYDNLALGNNEVLYATHPDHGLFIFQYENDLLSRGRKNAKGLMDMSVKGDYLYVVSLEGTLKTYEVSDPLVLNLTSTVSGLDTPWMSIIEGNYLYVADNEIGLTSFDISETHNPILLESNGDGGPLTDVVYNEIDPSYMYGAAGGGGLAIYLVENGEIVHLENIKYSQPLLSIDIKGNYLWASSHQDILLYDVTIPSSPKLINAQKTEQWAMAIAAREQTAIVADWAYLTEFTGDIDIEAPDIDLSTHALTSFPKEGGYRNFRIYNYGRETLKLHGATSDLELWFEGDEVEPQTSIQATGYYRGGSALQSSICISSNDPDEGMMTIDAGTRSDNAMMGKSAPDFTLEDLYGNSYTLSDYVGVPIVLIYFATW